MRRLISLVMLILCGWTGSSAALSIDREQFTFDHLGLVNGLSSQRVYSMVEGRYGSIWISMKNGIARYNGRTMSHYTLYENQSYAKTGGLVTNLYVTPDSRLLAFDNKGNIFVYHRALNRFIPYLESFTTLFRQLEAKASGLALNNLMIDNSSQVWISTNQGVFKIKLHNVSVVRWDMNSNVNGVIVCGNHYVVYTDQGAYVIDPETGKSLKQLSNERIQSAYYDESCGWLWLGRSAGGLQIFQVEGWRQVMNPSSSELPAVTVRAITRYDENTILLGLDGAGVYAADCRGEEYKPLFGQDDAQGGVLHGNGIYDILLDREGNIWMSSYTGGIDIAYPTGQLVKLYEHKYKMDQSLTNNGVNAVLEWGETLAFGTDRGVSLYNRSTHQWQHTLPGRVVLALCVYNGQLLVGTYGEGVYAVNPQGEARQAYSRKMGNFDSDFIYSIATDHHGELWIGSLDAPLVHFTSKGVQRFDIPIVECITSMPNGHMAVGTSNGFYDVDPERGRSTHYFSAEDTRSLTVSNYVRSLLFASNDSVWIATDGGGLYAYNLSTRTYKAYTKADGLTSNNLYGLAYDSQRRIVVSTDDGLCIFYPSTGKAININFISEVEREYNRDAVTALRGGQLLFGSNNGAVQINPERIDQVYYHAPLRFRSVRTTTPMDDETQKRFYESMTKGRVQLDADYGSVEIAYESIFYLYHKDILYQHLLEGIDCEWSQPSEQTSVKFDNLPAGQYTLVVRSVSRNSGRIIDTQSLTINVAAPWYFSTLAWMIYLLLAAAGMAYIWRVAYQRGRASHSSAVPSQQS